MSPHCSQDVAQLCAHVWLQVQKAVYLAHSLAMQGVQVDPALHAALLSTCVAVGAWDQATLMCTATHATQVRQHAGFNCTCCMIETSCGHEYFRYPGCVVFCGLHGWC